MQAKVRDIQSCKAAKRTVGKAGRVAVALLLAVCMASPLVGCKDTDVLTQLVIDQNSEEIDYSLPPTRLEAPQGEDDEVTRTEEREEDAREDQMEQDEPEAPTYDGDSPTDQTQTTPETTTTENAQSSVAPTDSDVDEPAGEDSAGRGGFNSGNGTGDGANPGSGGVDTNIGDGGSGDENDGDGGEQGDGRGQRIVVTPVDPSDNRADDNQEDNSSDNDDNQNSDPSGYTDPDGGDVGDGGQGEVYGGDGTYTKLPQNTRGIAATGQLATIVQMLGGKGALKATSADWLSDKNGKGAFPGELGDVKVGWSGDGSASSSIDVQAIIDSGATVVLTSAINGGLFNNQADADKLMDAGISVVVMPAVGVVNVADEDIVQSVRIVGELLKNAGGSIQLDSQAMAGEWVRQHDSVCNSVVSANGGYAQWWRWNTAYNILFQGTSSTQGTPTEWVDTKTPMFTCYIDGWASARRTTWSPGDSGATDNTVYNLSGGAGYSAIMSDATSSAFVLVDYYMQHAGVCDTTAAVKVMGSTDGEIPRDWPLASMFDWPAYRKGVAPCYALGLDVGTHTENSTRFARSYGAKEGPAILGSSQFPALVVRSPEIAENIRRSAEDFSASPYNPIWAVGGAMETEGTVYAGRKPHFLDAYQVAVLPEGVAGSWADGTPESFLAAPWAWDVFKCGGDMSDCTTAVNNYYETFYRTGGAAVSNYGIVVDVTTNKGTDY